MTQFSASASSDSAPESPAHNRQITRLQLVTVSLLVFGLALLAASAAYMVELNNLWVSGSGVCTVHVEAGKILPLMLTLGTMSLMGGLGTWLAGRRTIRS